MPASTLSPALIEAYRATHYCVTGLGGLVLHVDQPNPALVAAQRRHGVDCSAFVTACNPFSVELAEADNVARHAHLAAALQALGLAYVEGIGEHPAGGWPGEASFLVFGLDLAAARAIGTRFEQNALVWSGADGVPRLILLR